MTTVPASGCRESEKKITMKSPTPYMFRDEVNATANWFMRWNECEQTVALVSLLKKVQPVQARFFCLVLQHMLADSSEIQQREKEANSSEYVNGMLNNENKQTVVKQLINCIPLLNPGNTEVKSLYLKLIPEVLRYSSEQGSCIEESRQLLSYCLIHPAITAEDRKLLSVWLKHLDEAAVISTYQRSQDARSYSGYVDRHCGDATCWQDKQTSSSGQQRGSFAVQMSKEGTTNGQANEENQTLGNKSSPMLPPTSLAGRDAADADDDEKGTATSGESIPLSPQSSIASSGSVDGDDDSHRNTFIEEGSGMSDVPAWLKSLRLHKYSHLFSKMTYDEMMNLSESWLEKQNVTKGARHKIFLSIQKLKERQSLLRSLEKDVLEGGNLRTALSELRSVINSPIKAWFPNSGRGRGVDRSPSTPPPSPGAGDTDTPGQVPDGDIPGQFTRVMGKVCTQLLIVSNHIEDDKFTNYLQLIERCLNHEAFTTTQKKRLESWKQQVLKTWKPAQTRCSPRGPATRFLSHFPATGFTGDVNILPAMHPAVITRGRRLLAQPPRLPYTKQGVVVVPTASIQPHQRPYVSQSFNKPRPTTQDKAGVQRTKSAPSRPPPQTTYGGAAYNKPSSDYGRNSPGTNVEHDINSITESLCLSVTEHALEDGAERGSGLF